MFSLVRNLSSAFSAPEVRASTSHHKDKRTSAYSSVMNRLSYEDDSEHQSAEGVELSVEALIWFFEDYMASRLENKAGNHLDDSFSKNWVRAGVANANAPKADTHIDAELDGMREELKDVYFLIQDLRKLREKGVQNLYIVAHLDFMSAVKDSAERISLSI